MGGPTPDELDRLIDGLLTDDDEASAHTSRRGHPLMAAEQVRRLGDEPIPTDVRDRHLASIRRAAGERPADRPWYAGIRRRAAAVAAAASLAFTASGGGAVALAQEADPGDALYGLKRASERVALAVSSDDARLHLSFAERRLDELTSEPDHADELAVEAARQLGLAQEHGADLSEAGVVAVERLSAVAAKLENPNAVTAVSRACARIAERHGVADTCGYDGSSPGRSGEAPGQQGDRPGHRGGGDGAPGRSGDAPRPDGDGEPARDRAPGPPDDGRGGAPDQVPARPDGGPAGRR